MLVFLWPGPGAYNRLPSFGLCLIKTTSYLKNDMNESLRSVLEERLGGAELKTSELSEEILRTRAEFNNVDITLRGLMAKLGALRDAGYIFFRDIDVDIKGLSDRWHNIRRPLLSRLVTLDSWAREEIRSIRSSIEDARAYLRSGDAASAEALTENVERLLAELEERVRSEVEEVRREIRSYVDRARELEGFLKLIETSLAILREASFSLGPGEDLIFAAKSKMMDEEKIEGFFFMTDKRLLFEEAREVVVRRRFLFFAEKEIRRKLVLELPLEEVTNMSKGIVGLLAGFGLKISLRSGRELVFDLTGEEVDFVLRAFDYVRSGRADVDKRALRSPAGS